MARHTWALILLAAGCGRSTRSGGDAPEDAGRAGSGGQTPEGGRGSGGLGLGGLGGAGTAGATQGGTGNEGGVSDDTACSSDPSEIARIAFDAHLTPRDAGNEARDFVFYIDESPNGLELVVGSPGQAARGELDETGSEVALDRLLVRNEVMGKFDPMNRLYLEELRLCVRPWREGPPYLGGTAVLHVVKDVNDLSYDYTYAVDVNGELDTTPPEWVPLEPINPLDPTPLDLSEPLGSARLPSLVLDDAKATVLTPLPQSDVIVAFSYVGVLPLGVALRPVGRAEDLGGNELASPSAPVLRTPDDPGILTDGGFESPMPFAIVERQPGLFEDPRIISGSDAISGDASLHVPAGGEVVLHLTAPPDRRRVKLDVRPHVVQLGVAVQIEVRAGVVGGAIELRAISVGDDATGAAGAGGEGQGALEELDILLSEPGEDVLVSIRTPAPAFQSMTVVEADVDNVRVE